MTGVNSFTINEPYDNIMGELTFNSAWYNRHGVLVWPNLGKSKNNLKNYSGVLTFNLYGLPPTTHNLTTRPIFRKLRSDAEIQRRR